MDKPADFEKLIGTAWLNDLNSRLAAKGFRVISWSNYFGTRQIFSKKPIHEPKDLAGLNFRCGAAPMYVEMVKAMGARPITTAFAEVYTGLAQGTLDLLEAPLPTMWASKFYEQAKYASLTAHMIGWDPVVMSETVYQSMPADLQKIILEEAAPPRDLMTKLKTQEEQRHHSQIQGGRRHGDRGREPRRLPPRDRAGLRPLSWLHPGIKATVQGLLAK